MIFSSLFGPDGRFAWIAMALCRAVAAGLNRGLMDASTIVLVWRRVRRVESLLQALVERVRSGRYRGGIARPPVAARVSTGASAGRSAGAAGLLPRRFGWLIALLPHEAAAYGSQLACVLAEPEMVTLLRDVPQARRILRPLCVMLGLRLEPPAVAKKVRRAAGVRVKKVVEPFRIPLPRGVLAAARRQGYGKTS